MQPCLGKELHPPVGAGLMKQLHAEALACPVEPQVPRQLQSCIQCHVRWALDAV